jgi:methionine-rich copper-binding protein CopC
MRWFTRLSRLWLVACFAITGALGMSVWLAGVASAHASYDSSNPAAGAVLATAPTQVTVHFEQNINPAGENGIPSSLQVFHDTDLTNIYHSDQDAKLVSTGQTQFPASDAKTMSIAMTDDGNGIYEVYWHTLSADDGEADSGVFFFGVGTGNVLGLPATASTPTTTTSSGMPIWVTILVGLVGLVVGGGIVTGIRRRSQPAAAAPQSNAPSPGEAPIEKR